MYGLCMIGYIDGDGGYRSSPGVAISRARSLAPSKAPATIIQEYGVRELVAACVEIAARRQVECCESPEGDCRSPLPRAEVRGRDPVH